MIVLTKKQVSDLSWAVRAASEWRGLYTGDDLAEEEFNDRISRAKSALRCLKQLNAPQPHGPKVPAGKALVEKRIARALKSGERASRRSKRPSAAELVRSFKRRSGWV